MVSVVEFGIAMTINVLEFGITMTISVVEFGIDYYYMHLYLDFLLFQ